VHSCSGKSNSELKKTRILFYIPEKWNNLSLPVIVFLGGFLWCVGISAMRIQPNSDEKKQRTKKWCYFVSTVICPGCTMVMTPPHIHMHVETAVSAGIFPTNTVGDPGTQGVTVAGMQGMGVRTPIAEAVAEATVGLEGVIHIPNGGILTMGL
jgi:hypothetical protein